MRVPIFRALRAGTVTGQISGSRRRVGFMIEQLFARVAANDGHRHACDSRQARLSEIVSGGA
jgi:hypothetical protein